MDNTTLIIVAIAIVAGIYLFKKKNSTTADAAPEIAPEVAPEVAPVEDVTPTPKRKGGKAKEKSNTVEM